MFFRLKGKQLTNLSHFSHLEFEKLQSSVELDLFDCFQLGCLSDSIMHLSQLKTFIVRIVPLLKNWHENLFSFVYLVIYRSLIHNKFLSCGFALR
jgi:hypothetical protein